MRSKNVEKPAVAMDISKVAQKHKRFPQKKQSTPTRKTLVPAIGDIRNDNDANQSYKGKNLVLTQQQLSNWLLKVQPDIEEILLQILNKFRAYGVDSVCKPETITDPLQLLILKKMKNKLNFLTPKQAGLAFAVLQLLICYILKEMKNKLNSLTPKQAGLAFAVLQGMEAMIREAPNLIKKKFFLDLLPSDSLGTLLKILLILYGGLQGPHSAQIIHEAILKLCNDIENYVVPLINDSDGQVYQRLKTAVFNLADFMSIPSEWRDILILSGGLQSKL